MALIIADTGNEDAIKQDWANTPEKITITYRSDSR